MKILLDARKLGDGGIGVYIENLVDGLLRLKALRLIDLEISLLVAPCFFYKVQQPHGKCAVSTHFRTNGLGSIVDAAKARWEGRVRFIEESSGKYSLSEMFRLPYRQRKELAAHDIYHSPHYTLPYFLRIPSVVTIHDLIHLSHPETRYHRPIASVLVRSAIKRAKHVITVSMDTAERVRDFVGARVPPLSVVPNSLRPSLAKRSAEEVREFCRKEFLTRPYCLYVGSERPHKGFDQLLEAWQQLASGEVLTPCPDLVVVGKRFAVSRHRAHELGLEQVVRFVGEVSLDKLELLYSGAQCVVVPSRAEGFGLPALEGLGLGVPVVCAPIPVLREVCGDAAVYAETPTATGLAHAVATVLCNPEVAGRKVAAGYARSTQFSVEECALKTWRVYEKVLGRSPSNVADESLDRGVNIEVVSPPAAAAFDTPPVSDDEIRIRNASALQSVRVS